MSKYTQYGPGDYEAFPKTDHPLDPRNYPEDEVDFIEEIEEEEIYDGT